MRRVLPVFLCSASLAVFCGAPAVAMGGHHHVGHHGHLARYQAAPVYNRSNWDDWQYDVIARATARAQLEPGVTSELAPDSEQTATGGPSGGVPGFSGGM